MAETRPVTAPKPLVLEFQYDVGEAWIQHQIMETGMKPPERWKVSFDLREVEPPLRADLLEARRVYKAVSWYPRLAQPSDSPYEIINAILPRYYEEHEAEVAEERAEREANERETAEADLRDMEMQEWVLMRGSDRIRKAFERGYNINRLYALERAAEEFPGCWVDLGETADVRPRANPSAEALELEDGVRAHAQNFPNDEFSVRIVWLAEAPRDMEAYRVSLPDYYEDQDEAILIEPYLGRYRLLLPVDPDLQAPKEVE